MRVKIVREKLLALVQRPHTRRDSRVHSLAVDKIHASHLENTTLRMILVILYIIWCISLHT